MPHLIVLICGPASAKTAKPPIPPLGRAFPWNQRIAYLGRDETVNCCVQSQFSETFENGMGRNPTVNNHSS